MRSVIWQVEWNMGSWLVQEKLVAYQITKVNQPQARSLLQWLFCGDPIFSANQVQTGKENININERHTE